MKKTAVDYLIKEFSDILGKLETKPMQDLLLVDAINKAKSMEIEQIKDAYGDGLNAHRTNFCNRDEYFIKVYRADS
jgi:hypothetical protein